MKTRFLPFILSVLVVASVHAATVRTEIVNGIEWAYTVSDNAAHVGRSYQNSPGVPAVSQSTSGHLIVPERLGGYPVTSIDEYAFSNCSQLSSIEIPNTVSRIATGAFYYCVGLNSIQISDSLTDIGGYAFYHCDNLKDIVIPESVSAIHMYTFYHCSKLGKVVYLGAYLRILPEQSFGYCNSLTNFYCRSDSIVTWESDRPKTCKTISYIENPLLTISSQYGMAFPASGQHQCQTLEDITALVSLPESGEDVRVVFMGYSGTGSVPSGGTETNVSFTIAKNSSLTWNWRKENQIAVAVTSGGSCSFGTQWIEDGMTASAEIVPATHLYTIALAGDTNGVRLAGTTLSIPSDGPRNIEVSVAEIPLSLVVSTVHGTATPSGATAWSWNDSVAAGVQEPTPSNGVRYVCTGWMGTGSVPSSGTGTNVTFTIEEDSSIVWNWATNVWLDCSATGFASIAFEPCWTNYGETVVIPFEPKDIGFSWTATGDMDGVVVDAAARTISIPADRPRTVRFAFSGTTRADAASGGGKPVEWAHGGDAEWFVDFADENDESGFLRSGEIGTSSNSWTEISVWGPGRLDFDWRVSCNSRGHYAQILVDDTQWKRITGTTAWASETIEIGEGEHVVRWNYVKGTTSASGEDRACLDNVVWRPYVNLYVSSQGETNGVPYGSSTHLWGDRIEAQAGPPATYENERYVCSGWECRSIKPGFGSETNVSFNIIENSSLTWKWRREIWIEVKTRGPIEVPFESGWAAQHTNGTWSVRKVRDLETDIITYYSMSATNALHVEVLVPYTSFLLVCDDLPTTTNHFPMVASCLSTWNIFLSPPEPESESPSPVDSKDQLVDETSSHRVVFDKDSGILSFDCTHACRIVLIATEMTLATALDTHGLDWTTSGADVWIPQDVESSDGEDSAKSGTIRGDDASVLRTTLTGPGTLSWKWRLDLAGIAGVDVFLDNAPIDGLYEATDWAERSLQIAGDGEHEIRFEFWNAGDETTLSDCAYLDQVKWSGKLFGGGTETTPVSVPYEWLNRYPDLLEANGGDYEATAWSTAENGANKVWECYVAGLDPTNQASAFLANIEMKDDEPFISWTPDLGSERVYTVEGKEALDDSEWAIPTNELSRFFRVRVSLDGTPAEPREIFVRFHPNGGTVSPAFGFYESDTADCVFPVPTRVGYEFVGWFTDPEGGDRIVSVADAQSSSLSLFAHWSPIHYTIVFDANGGTGEMESIEASYGVATTLPPNSFKGPEGGRFQGWSRTADGTADIPDAGTVSNLTATAGETVILFAVWTSPLYCVIDLSEGSSATEYPVSYLANVPEGGWTDEYKTTKLVLRLVEAGSFIMGSNQNNESHRVELTKPFYIGVFEVTQKQYELVSGSNPSRFSGDTLPVDHVSYVMLRGASAGAGWPASSAVDADSFFGKLRSRTGIDFDLPTDAQWEYACRAGTTTTYYWGDSMDGDYAWYSENAGSTSHQVGTTRPNAWGIYDMAGNAWEWCLDWYSYSISSYGIDPKGPSSGSVRLTRSGNWWDNASHCPSAFRSSASTSCANDSGGFRIVGPLLEQ